jgi:hypothetical protein
MHIPSKMLMNVETAKRSPIGIALEEHPDLIVGKSRLVLHLIYEKHNPTSFWKPYLGTLLRLYWISMSTL